MANGPCSCITRDKFHILIGYSDRDTMVVYDRSQWVSDQGFLLPGLYNLELISPDKTTRTVSVNTTASILSKDELGQPLADGVYTFKVPAIGVGCGIEMTQHHYLIPTLTCKLMKARLRVKSSLQKDVEDVADIIATLKSAAAFEDYDTAADLYRIANLKLDALDCDCNCLP